MPSRQPAGRRRHIELPGSEYSVTEFKLPELGENIDQGDLVRLMVSLGASVTEGQPVMELETDKAVVEVPIFRDRHGQRNSRQGRPEGQSRPGDLHRGKWRGRESQGSGDQSAGRRKPPAAKAARPPKPAAPAPQPRCAQAAAAPPAPLPLRPAPPSSNCRSLGENIDQGDLVRLMISPGSKVSEGQPVMELETDKAVVEVPSSVTGTVKEIKVKEGDKDQSRPGDFHPGRRSVGAAGEGEACSGRAHFRTA